MFKKLLVAVLACLTIFLSKRALRESTAHPSADPRMHSDSESAQEREPDAIAKPSRTAVLL